MSWRIPAAYLTGCRAHLPPGVRAPAGDTPGDLLTALVLLVNAERVQQFMDDEELSAPGRAKFRKIAAAHENHAAPDLCERPKAWLITCSIRCLHEPEKGQELDRSCPHLGKPDERGSAGGILEVCQDSLAIRILEPACGTDDGFRDGDERPPVRDSHAERS